MIELKPCPFCGSENVKLMSNETEDGIPCCVTDEDELDAIYSYIHCYGVIWILCQIVVLQEMY